MLLMVVSAMKYIKEMVHQVIIPATLIVLTVCIVTTVIIEFIVFIIS